VSVIEISGLEKRYGDRAAVAGIDLRVKAGEIFGFLGPNGAGKTTTVEILEGYRERSAGEVRVLGVDPARADVEWRGRIGIVLQESRMMPELTVRETLDLFAAAVAVAEDGTVVVRTRAPVPVLHRLTGWALERGQDLTGLEVSHPSLEDVYLELTSAADDEEDEKG
jgi:ABC-type multidrug transport system ATPase subunit